MERKLKEVNATLDQERTQHVEQRDQVRAASPIFCQLFAFVSVKNEMCTLPFKQSSNEISFRALLLNKEL